MITKTPTVLRFVSRHRSLSVICVGLGLFANACRSPQGPITPETMESPKSSVQIVPLLEEVVGVPDQNPEQTSWTSDGRMVFTFSLQNRIARQLRLNVRTTFYDAAGVLTEEKPAQKEFLPAHSIRTFPPQTARDPRSKRVMVHISPAD